jgi:hypothetical protein
MNSISSSKAFVGIWAATLVVQLVISILMVILAALNSDALESLVVNFNLILKLLSTTDAKFLKSDELQSLVIANVAQTAQVKKLFISNLYILIYVFLTCTFVQFYLILKYIGIAKSLSKLIIAKRK